MKVRRLLLALAAVVAVLGLGAAQAQEVTVCYDIHLQVADQPPVDAADCIVLPPPAA